MHKAGIKSNIPAVPSISLGSADVNPFEVAEAYTVFANLGKGCTLRPFTQVFDESKNIVFENPLTFDDRFPAPQTFQVVNMLKGVLTRGTARYAALSGIEVANVAGKTGTTNDYKDAWFVAFSPSLLVLVWVGYDEEEKVGLTGASAALPLWIEFMRAARPFVNHEDFKVPDGLVSVDVDPKLNAVATSRCPEKIIEYYIPGTEPKQNCLLHP
jgi:membrane carboxypeptidase/penicillin-binding protein